MHEYVFAAVGSGRRERRRHWNIAQAEGTSVRSRASYADRAEHEGAMSTAAYDDKSPLINLISCIVCNQTMKLETSSPDAGGSDIIQYRCALCNKIERVRLLRRSRNSTD